MVSKIQSISVFYLQGVFQFHPREKLADHLEGLLVADNCNITVFFQERLDGCRVVRLHVLDDEIVRLPASCRIVTSLPGCEHSRRNSKIIKLSAAQNSIYVCKPFLGFLLVNRIHDGDLVVDDRI